MLYNNVALGLVWSLTPEWGMRVDRLSVRGSEWAFAIFARSFRGAEVPLVAQQSPPNGALGAAAAILPAQ